MSSLKTDSSSETTSDDKEKISTIDELNEATRNVESIISQLVSYGSYASHSISRFAKADAQFEPGDHVELQSYLEKLLLSLVPDSNSDTSSQKPPGPSRLSEIQNRLVNANLRRRNRFLYAQKEYEATNVKPQGLEQSPHTHQISDMIRAPRLYSTEAGSGSTASLYPEVLRSASNSVAGHEAGGMISLGATASESNQLDVTIRTSGSSPVGATTRVSHSDKAHYYPQPPVGENRSSVFRCPCCCQMLPIVLSETSSWR